MQLLKIFVFYFRITLNLVAATFVSISAFCNAGVWYHVKHLKVFDDEDEKSKEMQVISRNENDTQND